LPGMKGGGVPPVKSIRKRSLIPVGGGGTHHRLRGQQTLIKKDLSARFAGKRVVEPTCVIEYPIVICREMIYSPFRISNPRGVDGEHRSSPSANLGVRPNLPNLVCRL